MGKYTPLSAVDLDKYYSDFAIKHIKALAAIHPTAITLCGIGLNVVLAFTLAVMPFWFISICLFLRYTADVFDGAVARHYHKVSDIGGALDTISDNMLIAILGSYITDSIIIGILLAGANLGYMYAKDSLVHHVDMKRGYGPLSNVYAFFTNNTCLSYLIVLIVLGVM